MHVQSCIKKNCFIATSAYSEGFKHCTECVLDKNACSTFATVCYQQIQNSNRANQTEDPFYMLWTNEEYYSIRIISKLLYMSCEQAFRQAASSSTTNNYMKSNVRQHETKLVDSEAVSHLPQYFTSHPGKSMLSLRAKKILFTWLYRWLWLRPLKCPSPTQLMNYWHSWVVVYSCLLWSQYSYLFSDGLIPKTM